MADFAIGDIYGEIDRQAQQFGIDPRWAKSLLTAENTGSGSTTSRKSYSGDAVSSAQARGVLQVIPTTARGLQQQGLLPADWKHDPDNLGSQVSAGLAAMKDMQSRNKSGTLGELAAMYNGGVHNQKQFQAGGQLSPETQAYLPKVFRAFKELGGNMTPQEIERTAGLTTAPAQTGGARVTSSTTGTRQTSSEFDPGQYDAFLKASGLLGETVAFAKDQVAQGAIDRNVIGTELLQLIGAAGQSAGEAAQAKAVVEATGAARRGAILARAGLHADEENNRATRALDIVDQTSAALDAMRPDIEQRLATGFFDNPLAYIVNQTILPGQVAKYNQVVKQQQDALGTYRAAKEIAASQIDLNQGIDADKILQQGAAMAKAAADEALAKQKQFQLQLSDKAASDALTMVQLASTDAGERMKALQLTKVQTTESESQSEAQKQKARDETTLGNFNVIAKAAGGQGYDMAWFKTLTPAARTAIQQATSRGTFGKNFGESMEFINDIGDISNMAKSQASVAQWLIKAKNEARQAVQEQETAYEAAAKLNPGKASKPFDTTEAMRSSLTKLGEKYQNQANINMGQATDANPYKIPYQTFKKDPKWADNSYVQAMNKWGPGGTEQLYDTFDEQQIIKRMSIDAQMAGKNAPAVIKKQAADIAAFYKQATQDTAMATKWPMFGMQKPEKVYAMKLPMFSPVKPETSYDLADPAVTENLLTKKVMKDMVLQAMGVEGSGIFAPSNLVP